MESLRLIRKKEKKQSPWIKALIYAAVAVVWLGLWQLAAMAVGQEILVPEPIVVLRRLCELLTEGEFWKNTGGTLLRVVGGFAGALVIGSALGVLMHISRTAKAFFDPMLSVVRATPVTSFIILALVWIKSAYMPVFIAFLMVLPIVCANLSEGLRQVDVRLLEMAAVYDIKGGKLVRSIYVPSVAPYILAACRTGMGLAWKAGVAAEVIGRTANSIGDMLYESKLYLETVDLFAWTVVVVVLSRIIEAGLVWLAKLLSRRYEVQEEVRDEYKA